MNRIGAVQELCLSIVCGRPVGRKGFFVGPGNGQALSRVRSSPARRPNDLDAFVPASPLESATSKIGPVVHMDVLGQSGDGPSFPDLALPKPSRLFEFSMQQAEAHRQS